MGAPREHRALRGLSPGPVQGSVWVLLSARAAGGRNRHMAAGARCRGDSPVEEGPWAAGPAGAGEDFPPRRGVGCPGAVGRAVTLRCAFSTVTDCVLITRGKEMGPTGQGGRQWEAGSPELCGCCWEPAGGGGLVSHQRCPGSLAARCSCEEKRPWVWGRPGPQPCAPDARGPGASAPLEVGVSGARTEPKCRGRSRC